jgi:hypothetical protein
MRSGDNDRPVSRLIKTRAMSSTLCTVKEFYKCRSRAACGLRFGANVLPLTRSRQPGSEPGLPGPWDPGMGSRHGPARGVLACQLTGPIGFSSKGRK